MFMYGLFTIYSLYYSFDGLPMPSSPEKLRGERIVALFSEFVLKEHPLIFENHKENLSAGKCFVLIVHFPALCEYNSLFSQQLLLNPRQTLKLFNAGLLDAVKQHFAPQKPDFLPSLRCLVRIASLPLIPEIYRTEIPYSNQVGRFFALQCTVTRVGPVQVVQLQRTYSCQKCAFIFTVQADLAECFALRQPSGCPNTLERCPSTSFHPLKQTENHLENYQEIRVNEQFSCLSVGKMPRSICACLNNDLVDTVRPGDDIILNGVLTHRWRIPRPGAACEIELVVVANYIENRSEMKYRGETVGGLSRDVRKCFLDYWAETDNFAVALDLRNELLKALCPEIHGLFLVKLSLALLLVGAPPCLEKDDQKNKENNDVRASETAALERFRVRGSLHLLLVGEPGTAKSALLRASCRLAGRAILTAATGTTAAGLTAAAIRDSSGWALEAGALVLADGGLCAIDEFGSLRGADRAAVLEAMEQQTVSLAKAGLLARLNCRCSVVAAATASTSDDLGLPTPLLSRFDLVWRLSDPIRSETWDASVADFILGLPSEDETRPTRCRIHWSTDLLRVYIAWVRSEFRPTLSSGSAVLLQRYYELRRRALRDLCGADKDQALAGRTTLRLLESLVRLTQAHARLMARHSTVVEDSVVAIWLMECSFQSIFGPCASSIIFEGGAVGPEDVVRCDGMDYSFEEVKRVILLKLDLSEKDLGCSTDDAGGENVVTGPPEDFEISTTVSLLDASLGDAISCPPVFSSTQLLDLTAINFSPVPLSPQAATSTMSPCKEFLKASTEDTTDTGVAVSAAGFDLENLLPSFLDGIENDMFSNSTNIAKDTAPRSVKNSSHPHFRNTVNDTKFDRVSVCGPAETSHSQSDPSVHTHLCPNSSPVTTYNDTEERTRRRLDAQPSYPGGSFVPKRQLPSSPEQLALTEITAVVSSDRPDSRISEDSPLTRPVPRRAGEDRILSARVHRKLSSFHFQPKEDDDRPRPPKTSRTEQSDVPSIADPHLELGDPVDDDRTSGPLHLSKKDNEINVASTLTSKHQSLIRTSVGLDKLPPDEWSLSNINFDIDF
ncbi:DNA helicase mcm9 [Sparganum proliferum]